MITVEMPMEEDMESTVQISLAELKRLYNLEGRIESVITYLRDEKYYDTDKVIAMMTGKGARELASPKAAKEADNEEE